MTDVLMNSLHRRIRAVTDRVWCNRDTDESVDFTFAILAGTVKCFAITNGISILTSVLRQFTLEDVQRMVLGMEIGGLLFNHQGLPALDGQATLSLAQLKSYLQQLEAQC